MTGGTGKTAPKGLDISAPSGYNVHRLLGGQIIHEK